MTRNLKALTRADIGRLWDCHVDIVTRFTRTYPVPAEFKIFHPELGKEIRVFHEKDALDWMNLVMNSEPHRFENGKYRKKKTFCVNEVSTLSNDLAQAFITGRMSRYANEKKRPE